MMSLITFGPASFNLCYDCLVLTLTDVVIVYFEKKKNFFVVFHKHSSMVWNNK